LRALLDESQPGWRRVLAFSDVPKLPIGSQEELYLQVIRTGDRFIAAETTGVAIREGIYTEAMVDAIAERLSTSSIESRIGIISLIVDAGTPPVLMPLLRDALRLAPKNRPVEKLKVEQIVFAVNKVAGVIVNRPNNPSDIGLLRDAVKAYPEADVGWLALDKLKAMDDAMYTLARDVYSDADYGKLARLATAIAAQEENQDATGAALDIIRAYLREYSHSMEELFPGEGARDWRKMDRPQRARLFRMMEEAPTVLFLRFVKSDEARPLALEYLDSPNELVRDYVQLVAAQAWPEDVKANILRIPVSKRAYALAMIKRFHPTLEVSLSVAAVTLQEVQAAEEKLAKELAARPEVTGLLTDF